MTERAPIKDWSEDEGSKELAEEQHVGASPPHDDRHSRLRSRKRTAPSHSTLLDSGDEDLRPLSRLRSQTGKGNALRDEAIGTDDTRNRRSSRRLSAAHGGKVAVASDDDSEEQQEDQISASRHNLRKRPHAPADTRTDSQKQMQSPAGIHTTRSSRVTSRTARARPTEQEHQPGRLLRSCDTRATTRARAAAPQHDSSPEESSEESEPEPLHHRSARASRQTRRASKLVQGGGEMSGDDDSASDLDNFLAPSDDEAEEEVPSQAATNADDSDPEMKDPGPAAFPGDSLRQTPSRQPGTAKRGRLRKAQVGEEKAAHANGLAASLEDSEPGDEPLQHAPEPHEPGHHSDAGYRRYTPEEKGKQKVVEGSGPSGPHGPLTPVPPAQQQSEDAITPGGSSGGRPASKRRRLLKAGGQTVKVEGNLTVASRVTRSGRVRKERPDYKALWERKTAEAKTGKAAFADEHADPGDDDGLSDEHEDAAHIIIDDDDEEEEDDRSAGALSDEQKGAHNQGQEISGSMDVDDFIDEDEEAELDDGRPVQSPLQLAGLFDTRPDVDNCFNFYLDYLLECIADPDFPKIIRGDPRARKHYDYAIHKIEIDELARWRETYTKSDAWKRAIPGFITALERLPGCSVQPREAGLGSQNRRYSSGLADDDFEGTVRECAACTRKHTRAAMQLVLKGKLGDPGYIKGAKRLRDMAIWDDDEGESGSDRESILDAEDGEARERVYDVGSHCASRVHLYHSLWHYKRRLRCQLKKELKAARLFLEGCGQPHSRADCVMHVKGNDGLYNRLRSNFKQLEHMAKEYATMQATGGFRSASGTLDRVTKKVSQLMYRLNDDSDADSGSELQSDTDDEIVVVSDGDEAGPSGLPADEPEKAALPRSSSGDARRRLVLGDEDEDEEDDDDAGDVDGVGENATWAQASHPATTPLADPSEQVAEEAGAAATARGKAGQVIASSSEDEQREAPRRGRHASSAGQQQPRYRKPVGQPRYVPPAKRQSGRRAEDALKQAAASFQASPSRPGQAALSPAATPERQTAPGTPEYSSSPSRRPQPYFMARPQSRHEGPTQQQSEPGDLEPQAPGIGTDLGALLRQAQGSDAMQRLASMALPGKRTDSHLGPDENGEGAHMTTERSASLAGAHGEDAVQQMALAAAAASREALAAMSYLDDSPRSPGTATDARQQFQQGADLEAADLAEQAVGDVDSPRHTTQRSAAPVTAMEHTLAPAMSDRLSAPAQTPSQPRSRRTSQTSTLRQAKGASQGSKATATMSKGTMTRTKDSDSVSGQKGILNYFSPRSKK